MMEMTSFFRFFCGPAGELVDDESAAADAFHAEKFRRSVGGADSGSCRLDDDIGGVGDIGRELERLSDSARRIDENEIVMVGGHEPFYRGFKGKSIHSAVESIGSGDEKEIFRAGIPYNGTLAGDSSESKVCDVIDHLVGKTGDKIKASIAEIAVDEQHAPSAQGNRHREIGAHGRFADASLAGGKKDYLCAVHG